jgi:hypothetical protein
VQCFGIGKINEVLDEVTADFTIGLLVAVFFGTQAVILDYFYGQG